MFINIHSFKVIEMKVEWVKGFAEVSRWDIEVFFRNLKQNFHIKSFVGTSSNAVEIQIWTALITILLFAVLKQQATYKWHFSNLVSSLRLNTFTKIDLYK